MRTLLLVLGVCTGLALAFLQKGDPDSQVIQMRVLTETDQIEALNFNKCGIKVFQERKNKFYVQSLTSKGKEWIVVYDRNPKGDVYLPGSDNSFHRSSTAKNPMSCLGSDEFSNGHVHMSDFNTKRWGIEDGVTLKNPASASMFIFYGNNQQGDWGSMNKDAETMLKYANQHNIKVYGLVTNNHAHVTHESVAKTEAQFRTWFQGFLKQTKYKDLIFTVSTHGLPYKYKNYDMDIQGEGILIGKDSRGNHMIYKDKELMDDINDFLSPNVFLHLVIDTCFSGGLVNLWEFQNRLSKNVILYSAANSEIVGWGGKVGGYLTRYWAMYAKPGRYAFQIADDILQRIEYMDQDDFPEAISTQIKYSRPALAVAPFLAEN